MMINDWRTIRTLVDLARLGQVGDARVRAHEHVGRVQGALHEAAPRLGQVDAAERRLGQRVGRHERQAVDAHLVDRVDRLEHARHPLEALPFKSTRSV